MSLAAFLLCAGYGQRLRPLTERIAKPAIPFLGRSALEINKGAVDALHPDRWLVNAHHLPEQIESLAKRLGFETLHEPEILGTGGCIANAASILNGYDHFLVHNADLIHGIDLHALLSEHLASGALATLAGIDRSRHNTLSVSPDGGLVGVHGYKGHQAPPESKRLTFAGIAFYRREFLRFLSPGCEDIKHYWMLAREANASIRVVDCTIAAWHDFGTPQGLWEAAKHVMESAGEFNYRYPVASGTRSYVSNEAGERDLPPDLGNVLVYEKTGISIPRGTRNRILGGGFEWEIKAEAASGD